MMKRRREYMKNVEKKYKELMTEIIKYSQKNAKNPQSMVAIMNLLILETIEKMASTGHLTTMKLMEEDKKGR